MRHLLSPLHARVPEPGNSGTEHPAATTTAAVAFRLREAGAATGREAKRQPGKSENLTTVAQNDRLEIRSEQWKADHHAGKKQGAEPELRNRFPQSEPHQPASDAGEPQPGGGATRQLGSNQADVSLPRQHKSESGPEQLDAPKLDVAKNLPQKPTQQFIQEPGDQYFQPAGATPSRGCPELLRQRAQRKHHSSEQVRLEQHACLLRSIQNLQ